MALFKVTISRTAISHKEVIVDVAHESLVEAAALEQAAHEEFPAEHDAAYSVEGWTPLNAEAQANRPVASGKGQVNRSSNL
jgi:hypothetical protein